MAHRHRSALLLACCALAFACRRPPVRTVAPQPVPPHQAPPPPPEPALPVPRIVQPIALDGELAESVWRDAARSGGFKDAATGLLAVPHSELRLAHDGQRLLLGLYAADEDIVARANKTAAADAGDDLFVVQIQQAGNAVAYEFSVGANGAVRRAGESGQSGKAEAICAVEMDGTLNDPADDDEEWVAECILPLTSLVAHIGDTLLVTVKRCDTPKGAARRCGSWHQRVQLQ